MNAYMNQYQQNQIDTASREQILIMLYDGAIRFCRQAVEAMAAEDRLSQRESVSRALAIITEFSNTLDREIGGEMAENLDALYHFMIRELTSANLQSDPEKITVVIGLLSELRETWMQAIEIARQEQKPKAHVANSDYTPLKASL